MRSIAWHTALARGCFLASSWTWVIGMFFPVYLIRDYGWPGWLAFALPNILGAAAMGVLAGRASSDFERRFARALQTFSLVTIAFHAAFLSWFLAAVCADLPMIRQGFLGPIITLVILALAWAVSRLAFPRLIALGVLAWCCSMFFTFWASRTSSTITLPPAHGSRPITDLFAAVPALMLGFFACPWLDLTFWRIRRVTPGATGSAAFVLGFGVFFLAMIGFTFFYAGALARGDYSYYIVAHIATQSLFTLAVHLRCRADSLAGDPIGNSPRAVPLDRALLITLALMLCLGAIPWLPPPRADYPLTRLVYELFMSFYGFLFPAFAWIVMLPRSRGTLAERHRTFFLAILIAGPMFALGYLMQWALWLLPAVGAVLMAPLAARSAKPSQNT
jgi:hypothetical protein